MPVKVSYDKIIQRTPKAILVSFLDHVTWMPLPHVTVNHKEKTISVADWLHPKLIWTHNWDDIDLVLDRGEVDLDFLEELK
ncbi:MAG TPA: hypothetical protein DEG42_05275 [Acholeplasmataceae bacterium]|nr:hypothetical protein [Acholeplasmataceae bacterium]